MSTSKKSKGKSKEVAHKPQKFVNEDAEAQFAVVDSLPFIFERGFQLEVKGYNMDYVKVIRALKWETFCHPRTEVVNSWVYEFYANAHYSGPRVSFVRGKSIDFSPIAINKYFDLEDYIHDGYTRVQKQISPQEIATKICSDGKPEWKSTKKQALKARSLSRESKVWLAFINASLLPTKHTNSVSLERAALIFSILRHEKINVGNLISKGIHDKVFEVNLRLLWFPSLITELCRASGVVLMVGDYTTTVGHHITEKIITKNIKVPSEKYSSKLQLKGKGKKQQTEESSSVSAEFTQEEKDSLNNNIHYIKEYQRVQHVYLASRLDRIDNYQQRMMLRAKVPFDPLDITFEDCFDDDGYLLDGDKKNMDPDKEESGDSEDEDDEANEDSDAEED